MKVTTNYNLKKPDANTDLVNINDLNGNFDIIDEELADIYKKNFALGNTKICTNALLISDEYDGYTGVREGQTINLPTGFKVGMRLQLRYDSNNYMLKIYDTQSNKEWINFYNGVNWCGWIENIDNRGGTFGDKITVKKDDGYVEVEDLAGRRIAMHTNKGVGWIHLFDAEKRTITDLTLNQDGSLSSRGTPITMIPCCKVYHPYNQVIPGGNVKNTLAWDSGLYISHPGMGANAGTSANIVVPEDGLYQFDATINVSGAIGQVNVYLSKNNSETIDVKMLNCNGGNNSLHLSGLYSMTKGEYVQVHAYCSGSGSFTVFNSSRFQGYLVRGKI